MADYYAQVQGHYASGRRWSFGWHITSNQSPSALMTTWDAAWLAAWTDGTHGLEALYPTGTVLDGYTVATLDSNYNWTSKVIATASLAGTSVADELPELNACVISLRSTSTLRAGRGRNYLPAFAEDQVNGDVIIPTAVTRVSGAVRAVQTAIQADGSTIFVARRGVPHPKPPNPVVLPGPKFVITTILTSNKPARQSRRTRKVRPTYT